MAARKSGAAAAVANRPPDASGAASLTLREFGRRQGVSGEAVRKAIASGRIPPAAVGAIELRTGRKRPVIVDEALAAKAFVENADDSARRGTPEDHARGGRMSAAARAGLEWDDDAEPPAALPAVPGVGSMPVINESKRIEAAYRARLVKLEHDERVERLVDAAAIRELFTQQVVEARTKILGIGRMARERLPHLTIDDIEVIEAIAREALEEISHAVTGS